FTTRFRPRCFAISRMMRFACRPSSAQCTCAPFAKSWPSNRFRFPPRSLRISILARRATSRTRSEFSSVESAMDCRPPNCAVARSRATCRFRSPSAAWTRSWKGDIIATPRPAPAPSAGFSGRTAGGSTHPRDASGTQVAAHQPVRRRALNGGELAVHHASRDLRILHGEHAPESAALFLLAELDEFDAFDSPQQGLGLVAYPQAAQQVAGRMIGNLRLDMRPDSSHSQHVDQELAKLVAALRDAMRLRQPLLVPVKEDFVRSEEHMSELQS